MTFGTSQAMTPGTSRAITFGTSRAAAAAPWTPAQFVELVADAATAAGQPARPPADDRTADAIHHAEGLMRLLGLPVRDLDLDYAEDDAGEEYRLDLVDEAGAVVDVAYFAAADHEQAAAKAERQLREWRVGAHQAGDLYTNDGTNHEVYVDTIHLVDRGRSTPNPPATPS